MKFMNNNYAKFNLSQSYNIQTLTCLEPLHKLSDLASIAIIVALLLGDEFNSVSKTTRHKETIQQTATD